MAVNAMLAQRNKLRDALIAGAAFFDPIPTDPYICVRFARDESGFRGRLWFDRASYDQREDPMIELIGTENTR